MRAVAPVRCTCAGAAGEICFTKDTYQRKMFKAEIDGETVKYEMSIEYDEKTGEYVVAYLMDGEIQNIGRDNSVNRAVWRLAEQMEKDIHDALQVTTPGIRFEHETPECPDCESRMTRKLDDEVATCFMCGNEWHMDE